MSDEDWNKSGGGKDPVKAPKLPDWRKGGNPMKHEEWEKGGDWKHGGRWNSDKYKDKK